MPKDTTTMTLSVPDGKGGTLTTGPFTADDLNQVTQAIKSGRPPMKNTPADQAVEDATYRVTASEIRAFVERFERLNQEKADIAEAQKEVMAEAKGRGYDTKVLRKVIALRKRDKDDVAEENAVLEMYLEALEMEQ